MGKIRVAAAGLLLLAAPRILIAQSGNAATATEALKPK